MCILNEKQWDDFQEKIANAEPVPKADYDRAVKAYAAIRGPGPKLHTSECVFPTAKDCSVSIYASRPLERRDVENIIKYLQTALDAGCY